MDHVVENPEAVAMGYNESINRISQLSIDSDQNRVKPRFDPSSMKCNRGKLVDISAGGFAVRSRGKWGKKGKPTTVELSSANGQFTAEVEVVRIRRVGFFGVETGCRFLNADLASTQLFELFRERVGSGGGEFMCRSAG